jgi:hypothetical protein
MAAETTTLVATEDAEAVAAAEQAEQDSTGEHIVGFGCQSADRVFLAAVPGQRHAPYTLTIQCPGCGKSHAIKAMPRPRRPRDEIAISVEPPAAPDPDDPTTLKGRQQVSDAAILEALPEQDTPALEVARALGYAGAKAGALIKRCRLLNERAEAKGERPPVVLTITRPGVPALLRRGTI